MPRCSVGFAAAAGAGFADGLAGFAAGAATGAPAGLSPAAGAADGAAGGIAYGFGGASCQAGRQREAGCIDRRSWICGELHRSFTVKEREGGSGNQKMTLK